VLKPIKLDPTDGGWITATGSPRSRRSANLPDYLKAGLNLRVRRANTRIICGGYAELRSSKVREWPRAQVRRSSCARCRAAGMPPAAPAGRSSNWRTRQARRHEPALTSQLCERGEVNLSLANLLRLTRAPRRKPRRSGRGLRTPAAGPRGVVSAAAGVDPQLAHACAQRRRLSPWQLPPARLRARPPIPALPIPKAVCA